MTSSCADCERDVCAPPREIYMVQHVLWESVEVPLWEDDEGGFWEYDLCIGCLEKRLGRRLYAEDFPAWVGNSPSPEDSARLTERQTTPKPIEVDK